MKAFILQIFVVFWRKGSMKVFLNKYDLHSYDFNFSALTLLARFFSPKYGQKHCKSVNSDLQANSVWTHGSLA